ncbi:hypothetical protein NQK81_20920 [Amycolatopsis roodepoortensis]|uniref:hypothetical protein n=1 Tax=Amycolatopsis TaxID=1813 RepID=UPI000F8639DC|nr:MULTISPECIES: hypothetical protein [Amycolatopsis]QXV60273.1 hypothetical protein CVV72_26905 [Amycolatopsis sp. TNS106]RSN20776.1 hypothetical protein DMC63_10960 [Streptomyces sp. WAC 05977]UUV35796.1 hypothetical protein NQK81_20920 [Amycolatopsis roodepoortensis]
MSGARIEETLLRTRIALSLGALLLAGGAAFATTSLASADQSAPSPTATQAPQPPTKAPTAAPGEPTRATTAPARPEPAPQTTRPGVVKPGEHRVPKAVPAGPTGDLHLPAIVEGAGN